MCGSGTAVEGDSLLVSMCLVLPWWRWQRFLLPSLRASGALNVIVVGAEAEGVLGDAAVEDVDLVVERSVGEIDCVLDQVLL